MHPLDLPYRDFFRRRRGSEILIQQSCLGSRDMLLLNTANHDPLLAAKRPVDLHLIAGANGAVRFRRLPIHRNLAALTGLLRFGSRTEQARDVQPDVEADVLDYVQIRSLRVSSSAKLMAQIMITKPRKIITSLVFAAALAGTASLVAQAPREPDWKQLEGETMRHFQAVLRLDTSNPPGNEVLVTDYLKTILEKEGIPVQIFASDPKRPNLVARLKGNGRKQPLLYMGHTDVVTVDPTKWTFPPFSATRDGGYIYGRGSLDDKPHVIAGLMTMLMLKRLNVPLDRDVIFLAEAGEEGSTGVGIGWMVNEHYPEIQAEYCFAEAGNVTRVDGKVKFAAIQMLEKISRGIELVATGPSGHGSAPLPGNAIVHLSAAVAALGKWRVPIHLNETTREFFTRMALVTEGEDRTRYRAVLTPDSSAAAAADASFAEREPRYASMLRTSISPTIINGGIRSNVIPSEAKARLDVRMLPDEDPAQFLEAVRKIINDPAVTARYVADNTRPAGVVARMDSDAFRAIESAVARDYDSVTIPMMGTGATDMAQIRAKGQQCYGIGPATDLEDVPKGYGAHSDQERILEAEIHRFVRFSYDIVTALARTK
jgi:acetylornithine deacetylase/succinyl-diaminopimelate desuccinylase-like protein